MDLRNRLPSKPPRSPSSAAAAAPSPPSKRRPKPNPKPIRAAVQASDALPLPIRLTNKVFPFIFMASMYYLMARWREKIRSSIPLHSLSLAESVAIIGLLASVIYLIDFFGIAYVQPFVSSSEGEEEEDDDEEEENSREIFNPQQSPPPPLSTTATQCPLLVVENPEEKFAKLDLSSNGDGDEEEEEIVQSVVSGRTPSYILESRLGDTRRAAGIRKETLKRLTGRCLEGLPLDGFDYDSILGQCCEMPIGYVQLPVGVAGPLLLNGNFYYVPMATTEGCLVASTNRGCKAIAESGGAAAVVVKDGMTRAPCVRFETITRAAELKFFLEDPDNFDTLAVVFNRSSRFARLQRMYGALAGRNLYIRFMCSTGDAMGMNMVSKGVQNVLDYLQTDFPDMEVISISGNFCADKKPAAVNWIEGRGKSVVCEAVIKEEVVKRVLKTTVPALVELNTLKNLVGSAVAGSLGGYNAHASNIVSAVFIATGQDPAQNVESSHCITLIESVNDGKDLHISVTMPSIEVGTVGGGTQLASQSACLDLLGVKGANMESPGANARLLATLVAGAVLAGELSLMSALAAGTLVKSHMKYNRSSKDVPKSAS